MKKLTEIGLALLLQNSAMSTWGLSQEDMVCLTDPSLYSVAIPRHNEMGGAEGGSAILLDSGTRIYLSKRFAFLRKMP